MKNLLLACAYVSTIALDCAAQSPPLAVMGETYVVENTVLNMRSGPGTQHGVIGKLAPGNTVELVRGEGTWWLVEGRGVQGYVAAQYLRRTDLAGWVPKDYRTGATPECENVTPRYDRSMDNFRRVKVGSNTDVVVKLMKAGSYGDECIRIVYVRAGDTYEMENVPEGRYYLKIAYGKDYRQRLEDGQCKVRFVKNALYEKGTDILDYNKKHYPGGWQEPSYELSLNVITTRFETSNFNSGTISEDEFNR
ncbi:MAG: SH3 domain-containing protein [Flavobacteriales bacterium]|nr:SH3 domain-containing protein [Flavobacteriales bacterium]